MRLGSHGVNVQVLTDPAGRLVWASPALPGAVHDLTAARRVGLIDALTANGVMTFADKGYKAREAWFVPRSSAIGTAPGCHVGRRTSTEHTRIRALGERAVATLKAWKLLSKLRCCPHRATSTVEAVLVLQTFEDDRWSG